VSDTRRLTESVKVRVSADELLVLREKAARAGISVPGLFRAAAVERKAPAHTPELLRGLADVGRLCGLLSAALQARDTTALRAEIGAALTVARTVAEELRKR
jgi:hypothetical protein